MQATAWSKGLRVTGDGAGVVSHVGAALLRMLADRTGLTGHLSQALARGRWWPTHDRVGCSPTWPWASHITTAFTRIAAIPAPG